MGDPSVAQIRLEPLHHTEIASYRFLAGREKLSPTSSQPSSRSKIRYVGELFTKRRSLFHCSSLCRLPGNADAVTRYLPENYLSHPRPLGRARSTFPTKSRKAAQRVGTGFTSRNNTRSEALDGVVSCRHGGPVNPHFPGVIR